MFLLIFLINMMLPAQLPRIRRAPATAAPVAILQNLGIHGFTWMSAAVFLPLALWIVRRGRPPNLSIARIGSLLLVSCLWGTGSTLVYFLLATPTLYGQPFATLLVLVGRSVFVTGLPFWIIAGFSIMSFRPANGSEATAGKPEAGSENGQQEEFPVSRFAVRKGDRIELVPAEKVHFISAAGNYTYLHTDQGDHLLSRSIGDLATSLDPGRFTRIHRSRIVNIESIVSFESLVQGEYLLTLVNGARVKSGRTYRESLRRLTR